MSSLFKKPYSYIPSIPLDLSKLLKNDFRKYLSFVRQVYKR